MDDDILAMSPALHSPAAYAVLLAVALVPSVLVAGGGFLWARGQRGFALLLAFLVGFPSLLAYLGMILFGLGAGTGHTSATDLAMLALPPSLHLVSAIAAWMGGRWHAQSPWRWDLACWGLSLVVGLGWAWLMVTLLI